MADVRDILDLEQPASQEVTRESILGLDKNKKPKPVVVAKPSKRPEGMHREVFALLYNDNKDAPPLFATDTKGSGYKETKIKLGMKKPRKWQWMPFTNPARADGAIFHHWRRPSDELKDYPFSVFNKSMDIVSYTDAEYNEHLISGSWSKDETDHLIDLAHRFDLRFVIMQDRYDTEKFTKRSIEDLKDRYYSICALLSKSKSKHKIYVYDVDHEKRRKEQLRRLLERTSEQIEEEQVLMTEMKKIEARKKEREKKTQDLQKLISQADNPTETPRKTDKKLPKKKVVNPSRTNKLDTSVTIKNNLQSVEAGIRFPDLKSSGASLRSTRMKLPAHVGQKKAKGVEHFLIECGLDLNPMPTEEIVHAFNDLRSDIVLLMELKSILNSCEFELQSMRHQYEALAPDKTLSIPVQLKPLSGEQDGLKNATGEIIDVVGSPGTPT